MLLVGPLPTPTSERVDLTLKAPQGNLEVRLAGRVIRVTADPGGQELHLALEFVDLDPKSRDAIEVLLARLMEGQTPGHLDALKPNAPPHEVKKVLEAIPLAHRIALAQRSELKHREFLRQDTNPAVLEALVRNPNLILAEARAIATSPFLQSGTIDLLASDPRFKSDEEMRMTLATHPRVSMPTAERLTADFKPPQIKRLITKPGLNPTLRDKLFKKLTRG